MTNLGQVLINGMPYLRPVIRVAVVTFNGAACTVPATELLDVIDDGNEYSVQIKTMAVSEFEQMDEFGGW